LFYYYPVHLFKKKGGKGRGEDKSRIFCVASEKYKYRRPDNEAGLNLSVTKNRRFVALGYFSLSDEFGAAMRTDKAHCEHGL
jgi:hypothetical protein